MNSRNTSGPAGPWERLRPVAIVRLTAAVSLFAVGAIHIQQYAVENYSTVPTIGPLFLMNFIGATVLGFYFLVPSGPRAGRLRYVIDTGAAVSGWLVAGGALVALLISEHTPLFGFMEHGYRPAIQFAIVSEAVAIVTLTVFMLLNRREARRGRGSQVGERRLTLVRPADTAR
jgi:hypothetical protein